MTEQVKILEQIAELKKINQQTDDLLKACGSDCIVLPEQIKNSIVDVIKFYEESGINEPDQLLLEELFLLNAEHRLELECELMEIDGLCTEIESQLVQDEAEIRKINSVLANIEQKSISEEEVQLKIKDIEKQNRHFRQKIENCNRTPQDINLNVLIATVNTLKASKHL